ncbi:TetR/AcrR family transcriptional regulator [Solicola gregarius]|uniref:TetR/AcrR family transcriptional regulator n=1 Tax=Solicola gregarius TaxID=2908642 RepID=A0AA46TKU3_9ACTN|nr:TetR/AcrR family transcriptional regulator [Solicola gregarius]UYM07120.1 TetR/AcrR family transcriptional regulator [Solicola gregarius]
MPRTDPSEVDTAILAAARSCVLDFGVRKTTLAEVARRARVSRPTVYRRWADTDSLIAELITREFRSAVSDVIPAGPDARTRIVRGVVEGSRRIRNHEVFVKVFHADADLLLTYIVERLGRTQHEVLELCAAVISAGQADGSVREGDPEQMAMMVLLIVQSSVQSARMIEATLPPDALDEQLTDAVDGFLAPRTR